MNSFEPLQRASIEVAGGCNYTCKMCPQSLPGRGPEWTRLMPLTQFTDILDQIIADFGTPQINLEGSGEPTLNKRLPEYISAVKQRGLVSYINTNGKRFTGDFMQECVDAGLNYARFSCVGYDSDTYTQWMNQDYFEGLKLNIQDAQDYVLKSGADTVFSSYHLILDNTQTEWEIDQYRQNFIEPLNITAYIWKQHNWSGNYSATYNRDAQTKRSCGRPSAPEITIRAGGVDGKTGAVVSCCQTLGPPREAQSVLGHVSESSVKDIYTGELYQELREKHSVGDFDSISYCKDCDFLLEDPETLIWTNDPQAEIDHMLGTDFSLRDYRL